MQKVYRVPRWQILFFPSLFFGGGLAMLLFGDELFSQLVGVIALPMSIYAFWVLNNTKVIIDDEYLISENYLSSFGGQRIKMRWSDIGEIYTTSITPVMKVFITYVIPKDLKIRDDSQREKFWWNARSKEEKNIIIITSFPKDYRELITEISKRAYNASIDEGTKKVIIK